MNVPVHLFAGVRQKLLAAVEALQQSGALPAGLDVAGLGVDVPRDRTHGDLATNAAMLLAKPSGRRPMDIAADLAEVLGRDKDFAAVSVAAPGFVNLVLTRQCCVSALGGILRGGAGYGANNLGEGRKVNVEYVSANPTGPLHIGHVRGAVFGDALANLLQWSGFAVCREYYINDAGAQVDALARSAFARYREALGEAVGDLAATEYPGEYLRAVGEALAAQHGRGLLQQEEAAWLPVVRGEAVAAMMEGIRADLRLLGIEQERFSSERGVLEDGGAERVLQRLSDEGLLYEGVPEPPKGKAAADWQPRKQTLFRSTGFGDDADRPLLKADGSGTYFLNDIAYHFDKFCRGHADMIDVWGADHGGYIQRLQAAIAALTGGQARLDIKICQIVRLLRRGEVVKMSKRAGAFVSVAELVQEAGRDATRFMMLYRKNDAALDFDFAKVVEQSRDNPVFYVQYAHARACSALNKAAEAEGLGAADLQPELLGKRDFGSLAHDSELELIKRMAAFPHVVEGAAQAHEPHRIAFFLYELAAAFHGLWSEGKRDASLRFIAPDRRDETLDRLALVCACKQVLANGLAILGVQAPEEMR